LMYIFLNSTVKELDHIPQNVNSLSLETHLKCLKCCCEGKDSSLLFSNSNLGSDHH
jgi:hypothetical protein